MSFSPPLVFTHPLVVISPNWHVERPMRRPIAFRPTCSQVLAVRVCSNVCTPLPPGYAWVLRPFPLVLHAILKGASALPSGVGPADRAVLEGGAGTQRRRTSATTKLKQASTIDCFDHTVLLCLLLHLLLLHVAQVFQI